MDRCTVQYADEGIINDSLRNTWDLVYPSKEYVFRMLVIPVLGR